MSATIRSSRLAVALPVLTLVLLGGVGPACGSPDRVDDGMRPQVEAAPVPQGAQTGVTRGGSYHVRWVSVPAPIPLNEPFELIVDLTHVADDSPVIDATLMVEATMPAHGHGMNLHPRVVDRIDGRYRVAGMLFHMSGFWQIDIDVIRRHVAEGVRFDVDLP